MKKILTVMLLLLILTAGAARAETTSDVFIGKWILTGGSVKGKKIEIGEQDSGFLEFRSDDTAALFLKNGKKEKTEVYSWEFGNDGFLFTDKNGGKEFFKASLSENNTLLVLEVNPDTILNLKRFDAAGKISTISREQFIGTWKLVKLIENDDTSPLKEDENVIFEFRSDGSAYLEMKMKDKIKKEDARWYFDTDGSLTIKAKDGEEERNTAVFSENGNILTLGQNGKFGVLEKISSSKSSTLDIYKDDIKEKK